MTQVPPDGADPVLWGAARWWTLHQPGGETPEAVWVAWDALSATGRTPDGEPKWLPPIKGGAQVGTLLRRVQKACLLARDGTEAPLVTRAARLDPDVARAWVAARDPQTKLLSLDVVLVADLLLPRVDAARALLACCRAALGTRKGATAQHAADALAAGEAWLGSGDPAVLRDALAAIPRSTGERPSDHALIASLCALQYALGHADSARSCLVYASDVFPLGGTRAPRAAVPVFCANTPTPSVLARLARRGIDARARRVCDDITSGVTGRRDPA